MPKKGSRTRYHHYGKEATHDYQLEHDDRTVWLNLDAAQGGLGSNSCGPEPLTEYRLQPVPRDLSYFMRPYAEGSHEFFNRARVLGIGAKKDLL